MTFKIFWCFVEKKKENEFLENAYHQHAKHLRDEPPVPRYAGPVFHEFALGAFDVLDDVFGVGVDPLDHFAACMMSKRRS